MLDQADRLTQLARELQHEARRLNAALGVSGPPAESGSVRERRFAPASERQGRVATGVAPEPDDLGSRGEVILELMRDELGLENAAAILDRLTK